MVGKKYRYKDIIPEERKNITKEWNVKAEKKAKDTKRDTEERISNDKEEKGSRIKGEAESKKKKGKKEKSGKKKMRVRMRQMSNRQLMKPGIQ